MVKKKKPLVKKPKPKQVKKPKPLAQTLDAKTLAYDRSHELINAVGDDDRIEELECQCEYLTGLGHLLSLATWNGSIDTGGTERAILDPEALHNAFEAKALQIYQKALELRFADRTRTELWKVHNKHSYGLKVWDRSREASEATKSEKV